MSNALAVHRERNPADTRLLLVAAAVGLGVGGFVYWYSNRKDRQKKAEEDVGSSGGLKQASISLDALEEATARARLADLGFSVGPDESRLSRFFTSYSDVFQYYKDRNDGPPGIEFWPEPPSELPGIADAMKWILAAYGSALKAVETAGKSPTKENIAAQWYEWAKTAEQERPVA